MEGLWIFSLTTQSLIPNMNEIHVNANESVRSQNIKKFVYYNREFTAPVFSFLESKLSHFMLTLPHGETTTT